MVTVGAGAYELMLTAAGSGIVDSAGNALCLDASDSWLVDLVAPTAELVDVTPDPRSSAVGLVTISCSEAVTGLNLADLSLSRGGVNVPLTGQELRGIGSSHMLDLSPVTATAGSYGLTLTAAGTGIA